MPHESEIAEDSTARILVFNKSRNVGCRQETKLNQKGKRAAPTPVEQTCKSRMTRGEIRTHAPFETTDSWGNTVEEPR
jgi:hypothetical protein